MIFQSKTLNGIAFGWKNCYFPSKVALLISSKKSLEICSFYENRQFSVKKLQTVGDSLLKISQNLIYL